MPLPPFPAGAATILLTRSSYEALRAMEARQVLPNPQQFDTVTKAGAKTFRLRESYLRDRIGPNTLPPFLPVLGTDDGGSTYYVTVTPGLVCERILTAGEDTEAMKYWPCPAQYDGDDLAKLTIASGEAVFVVVKETADGIIGASVGEPVDLAVLDQDTKSLNYIPGVQDGVYYYKLATLTVTAGVPDLEINRGGSHIDRDSGLTCDVRILDCPAQGYDPAQLLRISFISGRVVSLGETVLARPLAQAVEECNVYPCT